MAIMTYRDLEVWRVSMDLAEVVYRLAKLLPLEERFELAGQLRSAAVSIPANIAEGNARCHRREYVHHLSFARGSLAEVETMLTLANRTCLLTPEQTTEALRLCQSVGRLLNALISSLSEA